MVDALHGAPGIYSARYAGEDASDEANLDKATTIALLMKDEIAFLTSIPLDKIKRYKVGGEWKAM